MKEPNRNGYYTVQQAAKRLAVSHSTIWRWIDAGLLPAHRFGRRRILIERAALRKVIQPARRIPNKQRTRRIPKRSGINGWMSYPMSAHPAPDQFALIERLRKSQERMLRERGGKPLSSSVPIIREWRMKR